VGKTVEGEHLCRPPKGSTNPSEGSYRAPEPKGKGGDRFGGTGKGWGGKGRSQILGPGSRDLKVRSPRNKKANEGAEADKKNQKTVNEGKEEKSICDGETGPEDRDQKSKAPRKTHPLQVSLPTTSPGNPRLSDGGLHWETAAIDRPV